MNEYNAFPSTDWGAQTLPWLTVPAGRQPSRSGTLLRKDSEILTIRKLDESLKGSGKESP
jgi:hypothetical protein